MVSHDVEGSYLIADETDREEELGVDDAETWLDEVPDIPVTESCFEMEQDIDLGATVVTQVIEEGPPPRHGDTEEKLDHLVEEVDDLDHVWDW